MRDRSVNLAKAGRWVVLLCVLAALTGCATQFNVYAPDGDMNEVTWSEADRAKPVAVHTVRVLDSASYHVVRLREAEKPHIHATHDLVVTVLSGKVRMHLGDRVFITGPGDVIDIPRGVPHWAENIHSEPSEAWVVFTPAFDGKDAVPVSE